MLKKVILVVLAFAVAAAPAVANAAATVAPTTATPTAASKLSLSNIRTASPTGRTDRLAGAGIGPIAAGVILVGIAVGAYFLIDNHEDNDDDNSDSN